MGAFDTLLLNKKGPAECRFGEQPTRQSGCSQMPHFTPTVFVVDNDVSLRQSLDLLIRSAGWQPKTFASGAEFLDCPCPPVANCLVLELSLPGFNGLDLQKRLAIERPHMPVIVITRHNDVRSTVQAMKAGALEFLTKPLRDEMLLSAVQEALERSRSSLEQAVETQSLKERYASLTLREQQVMKLVVAGLLNKQIGGELGISEITVKAHRGKVMVKMKANSLPDLVRMATRLHLESAAHS
jgi:FixJ family two-component response regulator